MRVFFCCVYICPFCRRKKRLKCRLDDRRSSRECRQKIIIDTFAFFPLLSSGIGPKKPIHGITSATGHNCCPVCGAQIPAEELESHFSAELNRIAKSNMYNERQEIRRTLSMEIHAVQSTLQSRSSRWEVRIN